MVASFVSSNPRPILAPLTALLVVQLTLYESIRTGIRRLISVVVGVLAAVFFATYVDFHWYWLGLLILASIGVGRLLRLGGELMEVPISAMLIYASLGTQSAALGRVYETLIGAGVGIAVHGLIAPPLYVRPAGEAIEQLSRSLGEQLRRIAEEMSREYTAEEADAWLNSSRTLGRDVTVADRALQRAEQSLRLNPRARFDPVQRYDSRITGASLRSALGALEHAVVSFRGICRSLAERASGPTESESIYVADVREPLGVLFIHIADAVETYGSLVGAEIVRGQGSVADDLRSALTEAWADRGRLTERLRAEERVHSGTWELHGSLLANVDRLLREIDVEAREQAREVWRRDAAERPGSAQALRARVRARAGAVEPIVRRRRRPP